MQGSAISTFRALVLDDTSLVDRDLSNHAMELLLELARNGETLDLEDNADTSFGRKRLCVKTKHAVSTLETFKVIIKRKVFMVRAKELFSWNPTILVHKEKEYTSKDESINNKFYPHPNKKEPGNDYASDEDGIPEIVFGSSSSSHKQDNGDKDVTHLEDPFRLYDLLKNKKGDDNHKPSPSLSHPLGFTPDASEKRDENINDTGAPMKYNAQVMNTSQDIPWNHTMSLRVRMLLKTVAQFWESWMISFVSVNDSLGSSGGILCICIWEALVFKNDNVALSDNFIAIYGTWLPSNSKILYVAIYAPQHVSCKKNLDCISIIVGRWNEETIIMGDFNEV
nr:RNA-directed DNA polymerase, eukaryota [Tanacetum cinerariifolium]